jgi:hypothetical protein
LFAQSGPNAAMRAEIVRALIAIRPPATAARWEIRLRD